MHPQPQQVLSRRSVVPACDTWGTVPEHNLKTAPVCWNHGRNLPAIPENTQTTGSPFSPQRCKRRPSSEGSLWTRGANLLAEVQLMCQPTEGPGTPGKLSPAPGAHAMQPPHASPQSLHSGTHPGAGSQRCNIREVL